MKVYLLVIQEVCERKNLKMKNIEIGISSLGHIVELGLSKKCKSLIDLLLEATDECFRFAEKNDIKLVEIVLDPPDIHTNEKRQQFIDLCKSFPNIKKQLHGPFIDLCMCSHNSFISRATVESYIETAKICTEIGAEILTIHPGLANFLINSIKEFNKKQLIKSVKDLLDAVKNMNLTICIENMPRKVKILLEENEIEKFFTDLNRKDIFLTWDTSHSWTCDVNLELFWEKFHRIIKNIHLVDNNNKETDTHPALGSSKIDFKEIFSLINKYNYVGPLIIELSSAKDLPQSIEFISAFI